MAGSSSVYPLPKLSNSYFPAIPPKAPPPAVSYSQAVNEAPYTALSGVIVDGRIPDRHPVEPRCRVRNQVGQTNRWRLPESLYSDLLGSSQAVKAITMPYNRSMINIITAESPKLSTNLDLSKPYTFRVSNDRPQTQPNLMPSQASKGSKLLTHDFMSSSVSPTLPASAPSRPRSITSSLRPLRTFTPKNARPVTPKDVFLYHSKKNMSFVGPDVILECLGLSWELHRPFLQKSGTLATLLLSALDPTSQKYYRSSASETLDNYIKKSEFYSNEYRDISQRLSVVGDAPGEKRGVGHPAHTSQQRTGTVATITLDIDDALVTKRAVAVALGNLYHDELEVDVNDVAGVLVVATILDFKSLVDGCCDIMLKSISSKTACTYHHTASHYHQDHVVVACERWLELNLIPKLACQIQLREMSADLLQRILKSNRLFVYNEYSVYKTLVYWLFLQVNPDIQLMPSHSSVLAFFNSLSKNTALLERDESLMYAPLFAAVRLHGITDTGNIQDMQIMNILPQRWLVDLLSQHYHALQGGGDMSAQKNFNMSAVRQGFVVDDEPHYHSEILSLHGFHFELKAVRQSTSGTYVFYMQRLRPGDPVLSFRQCERHTFSMRQDREVRYCITVQYSHRGENHLTTTGLLTHKFGLGEKTSKSEVIKMEGLRKPIYVTYAIMFPAS
ncbi:BTB/POZ domain-containing protein 16-like isoform X2 [Haliotis rufescens]|uniref:BTB/POZ domain-containing protein 16-like isoform X2 n=1 Tax=Haliotis rufescens TaxID=6454 RepID=UPI00201F8DC1|nr:BTB/POZ domain-containing protein 16-like isoform X2 [Haliotis rufescens]